MWYESLMGLRHRSYTGLSRGDDQVNFKNILSWIELEFLRHRAVPFKLGLASGCETSWLEFNELFNFIELFSSTVEPFKKLAG